MDLTSTTFCVIMLREYWRGGGQGCILKHTQYCPYSVGGRWLNGVEEHGLQELR